MCLGLEQTSTSSSSSSGALEKRCEICTAASSSCLFAESSKLSLQHCVEVLDGDIKEFVRTLSWRLRTIVAQKLINANISRR